MISDNYNQRLVQFQTHAEILQRQVVWYPWMRALSFLSALSLLIWGWQSSLFLAIFASIVLIISFVLIVLKHRHLLHQITEAQLLAQVNARGIARCDGEWTQFEQHFGLLSSDVQASHAYSGDLDILGQGSLFQRINATATYFGTDTLIRWLLQPAIVTEIKRRQKLIIDLNNRMELRQHIEKEGLRLKLQKNQNDPEPFLQWAECSANTPRIWAWTFRILPVWTVISILLYQFLPISVWWWLIPVMLQIAILAKFLRKAQEILQRVAHREKAFSLYSALFSLICHEPTTPDSALYSIQQSLIHKQKHPESEMWQLQKIVDLIEVRHSPMLHLPLNILLLWDLQCLLALESWKSRTGSYLRSWFAILGEIEALCSLSSLASEMPVVCFPSISSSDSPLLFHAEKIGHPLIANKNIVYNDLIIDAQTPLLLITGSNMSGKSTLLRSIGVNAVLALAGGPVCAQRLDMSWMQVATSMRITDSLEHGISYFMAELQRIKRIIHLKQNSIPLLFLLDEILHGTNTLERRKAAFSVISILHGHNSIGTVTTHDLELAELCKTFSPYIKFAHFSDNIKDQTLSFDYKMREGICTTSNALKLMQLIGIETK